MNPHPLPVTSPTLQTLRYLRAWLTGGGAVAAREVRLEGRDGPVAASWFASEGRGRSRPAWIVLHGLTRTGRHHAQLVRFGRALAAGGAGVLIPDVPAWQALRLAPGRTVPTVRLGLEWLEGQDGYQTTPRGLVGFSFGAPQAMAATTDPLLQERLSGVVGFGGYCDLGRTIRFQLTGRHEWKGREHHQRTDPYGRWIVAGNYLARVPGWEGRSAAADALLELARIAGDRNVPSRDPSLDPVKRTLRDAMDREDRSAFDLFAPPDRSDLRGPEAEELAEALARVAAEADPLLEVRPRLASVRTPVEILHGRQDHLIPFTEAFRLRRALPEKTRAHVTVTRLFGHSAQDSFPVREGLGQAVDFFRALKRVMALVTPGG